VYDFDPSVDVDLQPAVDPEQAARRGADLLTNGVVREPPELVVYPSEFDPLLRRDALAWTLLVDGQDSERGFRSLSLVVDAHTGRILRSDDNAPPL